jgi:hypothetical protein
MAAEEIINLDHMMFVASLVQSLLGSSMYIKRWVTGEKLTHNSIEAF